MRTRAFSFAILLALGSSAALAQQTPPQQPAEAQQQQPNKDSHSEGTAPHNMGSTGWTGGSGGPGGGNNAQTTGQAPSAAPASDQPEMATGKDLKGEPKQFQPNKTPE